MLLTVNAWFCVVPGSQVVGRLRTVATLAAFDYFLGTWSNLLAQARAMPLDQLHGRKVQPIQAVADLFQREAELAERQHCKRATSPAV